MKLSVLRTYTSLVLILFILITILTVYQTSMFTKPYETSISEYEELVNRKSIKSSVSRKLKFILQWTSPNNTPFIYMGKGQKGFLQRNCKYTNCYVTSDRNHLKDYTHFDVIAFAGPELVLSKLPQKRLQHQKYVYANIEAADNYPVCTNKFNGYFNWTWTYRLNSDLRWGYFVIRDSKGDIVGPNKEMHWINKKDMLPVTDKLKTILSKKTKVAVWFVSNCVTSSQRELVAHRLKRMLKRRYNLTIDTYGECGSLKCSTTNGRKCNEIIRQDYYFYLSFENALSEDYVTEKLLHAVQYNAIPIVYGGANYSRFLPEGSYLDLKELGFEKSAEKIHELITNPDAYSEYFRWTNHYIYHAKSENIETDEYCEMCALLNDERKVKEISIYRDFKSWWDPPNSLCYGDIEKFQVNI